MKKRVFLIVLDSVGIGALPDADEFGDAFANTLKRISTDAAFSCENMRKLGLANIDGNEYLCPTDKPMGAHMRMRELSRGKDTTIGHWEIAGVVSGTPLPTYSGGFPDDVISAFEEAVGRRVICNKPYSGTDVIRDYGRLHLETGALIVYTSADSVFQIAAHEDIVLCEKLYEYCRAARKILCGKHAVGRVIARPFVGEYPDFKRSANRRDFSLEAPKDTMLDAITKAGKSVYSIGKISDVFAGRGISESVPTHSNTEGMSETLRVLGEDFEGLCFVNLVDFDMLYGHRQNITGYAEAFAEFDRWLERFIPLLRSDDILMICADHGCDPGDDSTDHTREYIPLIVYGDKIRPVNLGTRESFADISKSVCEYLGVPFDGAGKSMLKELYITD